MARHASDDDAPLISIPRLHDDGKESVGLTRKCERVDGACKKNLLTNYFVVELLKFKFVGEYIKKKKGRTRLIWC